MAGGQAQRRQAASPAATPQRLALLHHLTLASLPYSPLTALFFAERLFALDHLREDSLYLVALALVRVDRHSEAIWLLKQQVNSALAHDASDNPAPAPARKWTSAKYFKPANEASLRCARLFANACLHVGRDHEGRDVLAKALLPSSLAIANDLAPDLSHSAAFRPESEPWIYDLELARLARKAGEHERAVQGFRKALEGNPWCWEALEGLCAEGAPPDPDVLFPPRPRQLPVPISPLPSHSRPLPTHPPPLGPSQTSAVNSSVPFTARTRAAAASQPEGLGFFTPSDTSTPVGPGAFQGQKSLYRLPGAGDLVRKGKAPTKDIEMSVDDSNSSFDTSFYPNQPPPPFSYVTTHTASVLPPAFSNAHASGSSLFTPPPASSTSTSTTGVAPGVKRARGQQPPVSTRARDKKRTKNGTGPSVLSDAGSDAFSPPSHSSSPVPSSPGGGSHAVDPGALEAEDYVATTLRCFGRAAVCAARFESAKAVESLVALPAEQQKSWRCFLAIGRAHFEMLNYDKAEKAFSQARQQSPHILESMELYSTLLWHLRLPTQLSFLAQDLMVIAPRSSAAWIASGNVFSHLEDHASALKCFKRAAQLDENCVYAYTLSGHECVVLEEWERALGLFREAIRRDQRHYNAWFGLGNVYLQTGKYSLAEYHFRKAVEINPTNATLICCVGSVLEKRHQSKEALEMYERACVLAPESPAVRFKRVRILVALKRYDLAEMDLLALKDRAPNEFNVYFLLGKLYKALGRKPDMLKYFSLAQDIEPRTASLIRDTIQSASTEMDVDEGDTTGGL
ncbi:20S cyclosome subunit (BimA/Nuc2/Cdc27) [Pseudohyphozyma bogoriensis]|nr:20S cyclosome subunit (BimA/Nuc2/Cdc27) [Pseudohyphozyma bogoriensis]